MAAGRLLPPRDEAAAGEFVLRRGGAAPSEREARWRGLAAELEDEGAGGGGQVVRGGPVRAWRARAAAAKWRAPVVRRRRRTLSGWGRTCPAGARCFFRVLDGEIRNLERGRYI